MNVEIDLRVLELLSARLCHELVSPVAAINNGVELLGEDDPDFVKEAMTLLAQSARKAGQRLQFYRFAYGSAGGTTAVIDCRELAQGLLDGGKVRCDWPADSTLSGDWQKLAANMLVLAADSLTRGGAVVVRAPTGGAPSVTMTAEGASINFSDELRAALDVAADVGSLTSRTVHAYFAARLAQRLGARLTLTLDPPGRLVFAASGG